MTENTENNQNLDQIKSLDAEIKALREKRELLANTIKKEEPVSITKLRTGLLSLANPVLWLKDLAGLLNIRKLIIYALIIGGIYGYGYIKGVKGKPVHFDIQHKEAYIKLNGTTLHVKPDGTAEILDTKTGKKIKDINVKDVKDLNKLLKPIGFDIHPIFTAGGSLGTSKVNGVEVGIGASIYKLWKVHIDTWLTQAGVYIGGDYEITQNFGIITGIGQGYKANDQRIFLGGVWRF